MFTPHLQTHPLHRPPLQCFSSRSSLPPHLLLRLRQLRTLFITHETVTATLRTQQATTALTVQQLFSPPEPSRSPSTSSSLLPTTTTTTTTGWPALAPLWRAEQALHPHLARRASTLAAQIRSSSSSPSSSPSFSSSQPPIPPISLPIPHETILAREAEIVNHPEQLAFLCHLQLRWRRLALARGEAAYFRAHGSRWWRRERERQREWARRRDARHGERGRLAWVCMVRRMRRMGLLRRRGGQRSGDEVEEGVEEAYAWGAGWRLRRLRGKGKGVWAGEGEVERYRQRMLAGRRGRKGGWSGLGCGGVMLFGGSGLRREWKGE